jgi:uncharacterized protein with HEPN domain
MTKTDALRIPDYLSHILEALKRIFEYVDDIDEVGFLKNTLAQDAVIRNFEILGEASKNLRRYHADFIAKYPDVDWEDMYWMRNRLSHGYFNIDFEIIWKAIEKDLPKLQKQMQAIYDDIKVPSR